VTTSGIYSFELTARELVKQAMVELGAINPGEEPDPSEMDDAIVRLNMMLKTWGTRDNLYREETGTLTIPAGVAAGTLPESARSIVSLAYIDSATNHRLLQGWNRMQYYSLPNREAVGLPTIYFASQGRDADNLFLWPVNPAETNLHLVYNRAVEVVTDPSQTVDVPEEWIEAVMLGLADRLANMLGTTRMDPGTVQQIQGRASAAYQYLLDMDRPDSYMFEPYDG
jgi:hypothetical protein